MPPSLAFPEPFRLLVIGGAVERQAGKWSAPEQGARLLEELAARCDEVILCAVGSDTAGRSTAAAEPPSYVPRTPNLRIVAVATASEPLPIWRKALVAVARISPYWRCIRQASYVLIAMPSFSGYLAHLMCRLLRKPYGLYFAANWQGVAPFSAQWDSGAALAYRAYVRLSLIAERTAVRRSRFTLVAGRALFEKFRPIHDRVVEARLPAIEAEKLELFSRTDTCLRPRIRILYVGQLIPRKGVQLAVDALSQLLERRYDVELELVGTGTSEYQGALRHRVVVSGLEERVRFVGFVAEPRRLVRHYREADVFVIASFAEGFPRVIYESMAQGLPVVATAIEEIRTMVRDREDAVLVEPGSADALADGLELVIRDPDLRQRLIRNGRLFVEARLGMASMGQQILGLIGR